MTVRRSRSVQEKPNSDIPGGDEGNHGSDSDRGGEREGSPTREARI